MGATKQLEVEKLEATPEIIEIGQNTTLRLIRLMTLPNKRLSEFAVPWRG